MMTSSLAGQEQDEWLRDGCLSVCVCVCCVCVCLCVCVGLEGTQNVPIAAPCSSPVNAVLMQPHAVHVIGQRVERSLLDFRACHSTGIYACCTRTKVRRIGQFCSQLLVNPFPSQTLSRSLELRPRRQQFLRLNKKVIYVSS